MNAHNFTFTSITGETLPLSDYKGKVLLIVNTASKCGFTKQYDGLQTLYDAYKDQGLVVLGIPSNQFGKQEPGNEEQIKTFCETNFNITFPMTSKTEVKGKNAHPFYQWAAGEAGPWSIPKWNFYKYLIGRDGKIHNWFAMTTKPDSKKITKAIEAALAQEGS